MNTLSASMRVGRGRWTRREFIFVSARPAATPYLFMMISMILLMLSFPARGEAPSLGSLLRANDREALMEQGAEGLRYVMEQVHIRDVNIQVMADNLVTGMDSNVVVATLVEFLDAPRPKTRKFAAYFLGYLHAPEYADKVRVLLKDDEAAGAAARTLGKWGVKDAVDDILLLLDDDRERRRIVAINALRDIGDGRVAPRVLGHLQEPVFTVREVTQRALVGLGDEGEQALLAAWAGLDGQAQRHAVRALGQLGSKEAVALVEPLLADEDEGLRGDALAALRKIDPERAAEWWDAHKEEEKGFYIRTCAGL